MTDVTGSAPTARRRLGQLRAEAAAELQLDLEVPKYPGKIYVRYKVVDQPDIGAAFETRREPLDSAGKPPKDARLLANADVLVMACVGIYELDGDDKELSVDIDRPDLPWPVFDDRLAELLRPDDDDPAHEEWVDRWGREGPQSQVDTCRAFFLTDGDLLNHAAEYLAWAGFAGGEIARRLPGK